MGVAGSSGAALGELTPLGFVGSGGAVGSAIELAELKSCNPPFSCLPRVSSLTAESIGFSGATGRLDNAVVAFVVLVPSSAEVGAPCFFSRLCRTCSCCCSERGAGMTVPRVKTSSLRGNGAGRSGAACEAACGGCGRRLLLDGCMLGCWPEAMDVVGMTLPSETTPGSRSGPMSGSSWELRLSVWSGLDPERGHGRPARGGAWSNSARRKGLGTPLSERGNTTYIQRHPTSPIGRDSPPDTARESKRRVARVKLSR